MGKCLNCGVKKWRLKTTKCFVCGKTGCNNCHSHIMEIGFGVVNAFDYERKENLFICSKDCKENFVNSVEKQIEKANIGLYGRIDVKNYITSAIVSNKFKIDEKTLKNFEDYPNKPSHARRFHAYLYLDEEVYENLRKKFLFQRANIFLTVRRFEEAAKLFESIAMYEEAGKARAKDKHISIKRTDVSVDLNSLLSQIKDGGLIVIYRCPHCNAPLKVNKETNLKSLQVCKHCNTEIESMDIANFLKTALS
jgi:hypothetical protein